MCGLGGSGGLRVNLDDSRFPPAGAGFGGPEPDPAGRGVPSYNRLGCRIRAQGNIMDTIVFDTHAFVKKLTDAGMPEPQAEVLARTHAKLIDEKLATKQDLKALELRLTLRLGSTMVVAVGAVATLVKIL